MIVCLAATRVAAAQPSPSTPGAAPGATTDAPPSGGLISLPGSSVYIGGYLQPQFRLRQDSPYADSTDGFRFARARLVLSGTSQLGELLLSAYVEGELQPQFALQDAYGTAAYRLPADGKLTLDLGQVEVPISRQNMLSDSRLSFVDRAQLISIAPGRDLGARLAFDTPYLPVRVFLATFDGEGQNHVENINEHYLYAARVEITPLGKPPAVLQDSAFVDDFLTIGGSYGHNRILAINGDDVQTYLGGDVAAVWHGLSGEAEYLVVQHRFTNPSAMQANYHAIGWVGQLAYLLPFTLPPIDQGRLELAARIEEIDRNDTTPIISPGDPNQSVREITLAVSYYLRRHSLKVQLAANLFTEIEDRTATGQDATFPNDQLLLQVTYRLE